jgi:type IV secretory pathway VirB10-like protein
MITKPLVAGLLAAGCLSAAAGAAYVAVRQNAADSAAATSAPPALSAHDTPAVAESEGVVVPLSEPATPLVAPVTVAPALPQQVEPEVERPVAAAPPPRARRPEPPVARRNERAARASSPADRGEVPEVGRASERSAPRADSPGSPDPRDSGTQPVVPAVMPPAEPIRDGLPASSEPLPAVAEREFIQVVLPASSVIGLQLETAVSTERAEVEDRVDARVTRDVLADGRVAIPAGSRVIGSVTLVERGGKIKERARLGVRFHTLVFADGSEMPIRTEAIYREGDSPSGDSAKKIGGAAVGGAILGAILGGGKGAMIGGAAGAAGGTAATMAGGRNAATLPAGTVVTVRLSEPLTLDLEK